MDVVPAVLVPIGMLVEVPVAVPVAAVDPGMPEPFGIADSLRFGAGAPAAEFGPLGGPPGVPVPTGAVGLFTPLVLDPPPAA
ncbi:MAG: hypothetical protein JO209_01965 [Acidisphaera sp.]|nr:hypothetical protein [Acidisphaera sp.]